MESSTEPMEQLLEELQELRESKARLLAILSTTVDAIITIDDKACIQAFNAAAERLFGYEAAEVVGRNVNCLMPEPFSSHHDGYLRHYLQSGIKKIIGIGREVRGKRKDGTTFPMDLAVSEVRQSGRILFTGIIRDISERKRSDAERERLIAELEEKNSEMERFLYTVSHDLKSPLITIRGFLGMIRHNIQKGETGRVETDYQRIMQATDRMQQLLEELLELSRIGRLNNTPRHVGLDELTREAIANVAGLIAEHRVAVTVDPQLPEVCVDRARLTEVLQNLIENAVKFMGNQPSPKIEIGMRSQTEQEPEVFFVRDNGMGIDPLYREKIFGLFERLDPAREGTGIGLALVKRIIELHGGKVWVESPGVGQGSCFCFTLPTNEKTAHV